MLQAVTLSVFALMTLNLKHDSTTNLVILTEMLENQVSLS